MNHAFDIELAEKHGVRAAILIEHLAFWQKKNIANNKNYYDGHYWSYNSRRAFSELFPYYSEHQIYRTLSYMEEAGIIKTGNYNKTPYDRTKWYTIIDQSIARMYTIDCAELRNEKCETEQPIPDINTDVNTGINTDIVYECKFFTVNDNQHKEFVNTFDGIDIITEYKKMNLWLLNNPSKSNKKHWNRFITNWLNRAHSNLGGKSKDPLDEIIDKYGRPR